MDTAVALFERYATGAVSIEQMADDFAMTEGAVTMILRNPTYNGWVRQHPRSGNGERRPAAWRANPPVSDALWERVAEIRARRRSLHGVPWEADPADTLRGLLYCPCGARIKRDGTMGTPPRRRKAHPRHRLCPEWGAQVGYSAPTYERAIVSQISGLQFDAALKATIPTVATIPDHRIERLRRDLALAHRTAGFPTSSTSPRWRRCVPRGGLWRPVHHDRQSIRGRQPPTSRGWQPRGRWPRPRSGRN
jgi:hypothetical protein